MKSFSLPNYLLIILSSSANLFGNGFSVWKYFLKPYWPGRPRVRIGRPQLQCGAGARLQPRFAAESDFGDAIPFTPARLARGRGELAEASGRPRPSPCAPAGTQAPQIAVVECGRPPTGGPVPIPERTAWSNSKVTAHGAHSMICDNIIALFAYNNAPSL